MARDTCGRIDPKACAADCAAIVGAVGAASCAVCVESTTPAGGCCPPRAGSVVVVDIAVARVPVAAAPLTATGTCL